MRILSRQVVDMKDRLVRSILASLDISGLWHPEDSVFVQLNEGTTSPEAQLAATKKNHLTDKNFELEVKTAKLGRNQNTA